MHLPRTDHTTVTVVHGDDVPGGEVVDVLRAAFPSARVVAHEAAEVGGGVLSVRELEVLVLLADGYNPDAIARALRISPHTARDHVKRIRVAMGTTSILGAVMAAARRGLVPGLLPSAEPS
jgi:DNA-binding CsgD family transcriptional regulator